MLFQGQETGTRKRFQFFVDHDEELNKLVRRGRADFMKQFNRLATNRLETWAWAFRARAAEGIAQTASSHCEVKTIRQILYDIEEAVGELQ